MVYVEIVHARKASVAYSRYGDYLSRLSLDSVHFSAGVLEGNYHAIELCVSRTT